MSAASYLKDAADLIDARGKQRDKPSGERSMGSAVSAFWALFGAAIQRRGWMTETEGWEFMSLLKKARSAHGVIIMDDYLDDIAYCALAAESAAFDSVLVPADE